MTAVRRRTVASDMRAFEKFQQREARRAEREKRAAERAAARPPLRVRVTVEVEVDRDAYDAEYGSHESAEEVRAHVKGVVATAAESAFSYIDAVTVKGHH